MSFFSNSIARCITALAIAGFCLTGHSTTAQALLNPATQPKFVHQLPIPSAIDATGGGVYNMSISQFEQDLGLRTATGDTIRTKVWGYNGTYPGPTIVARKNVPIDVWWYNNLVDNSNAPLPHLLNSALDRSIHWAFHDQPMGQDWLQTYGVPIVTHLHGGHTESASDGLPESWYTPGFTKTGSTFEKGRNEPYLYENTQRAATIWYHDHALGITRLNVYAGLAGFYILTDDEEQNLKAGNKLPADPYDIGLAIQDKMFTATGDLHYTTMPPMMGMPEPSLMPEFFGNFILVNGKIWPVLDVEPRQYRFRMLNGSDSRFYNLFLSVPMKFWQVGSDLGLLHRPVAHDQLLIAPGERKDVVLDFSDPSLWGKTIIMRNNAKSPFPKGATPNPQHEGQIMAFRVNKQLDAAYPLTPLPATLAAPLPNPATQAASAAVTRKLILFEGTDEFGRLKAMLGTFQDGAIGYHEPVTEFPEFNSTEVWEIYNLTPDAHPIHLHLVSFRVLNTQKFKATFADPAKGIISNVQLIGQPKGPEPGQEGFKDTYPINPGEVARFVAKFDRLGLYVWHCHILSHEDHEMMRPYRVVETEDRLSVKQSVASAAVYKLYPNPTAAATYLQFNFTEPSTVSLRIFDLNGRLVKEVAQQELGKGEQVLMIDSNDLNSGIYNCEIKVNHQVFNDRIVVTR